MFMLKASQFHLDCKQYKAILVVNVIFISPNGGDEAGIRFMLHKNRNCWNNNTNVPARGLASVMPHVPTLREYCHPKAIFTIFAMFTCS